MEKKDSFGTQIIYENCEFNSKGLDTFVNRVMLPECRTDYVVVSIIGPQSGGKSTLMNHLFDTKFQEMNPDRRSQTTKGIWIAKCVGVEPCTIALDLEGTDGSERGEDDTAFEKKSALFALAISDIVMINIWCHEIGRERAANKPLLRTVFQVMLRLISPDRQKELLFVIRDITTQIPFENLELQLREDIKKIWDAVRKPQAYKRTPFSKLFSVHVVGLSNYEHQREKFEEEVAQLRQRFVNSTSPGGLASDRRGVVPASLFSEMTQRIWNDIKQNKDLDLPSQRVMVATMRCEAIADKTLRHFKESENWLSLQKAAETGPVPDFGKRVSSILYSYLSKYDKEVVDFDEDVRKSKRCMLETSVLLSAQVAYGTMLGHLCTKAFEGFMVGVTSLNPEKGFAASLVACIHSSMHEFCQRCSDAAVQHSNWSFSSVVEKLGRDISAHAKCVYSAKLSELNVKHMQQLVASLTSQVDPVFGDGREDMWVSIRSILKLETKKAISRLSTIKDSFEYNEKGIDAMGQDLSNFARKVVEQKARDNIVANKVLKQMKQRFASVFCYDRNSQPRVWKEWNEITAATIEAHCACLKILAVMATIDLDEKPNYVKEILFSCLMEETEDALPSSWQKDALFTPAQCQILWDMFKGETQEHINKAILDVEAHKHRQMKIAKMVLGTVRTGVNVCLAILGFPPVF